MQGYKVAEEWFVNVLSNDPQLGMPVGTIFVESVPERITLPHRYILITNQSALDVTYVNKRIGWVNLLYAVRVVEETEGFSTLVAPANRVHELLHRQKGITASGEVLACYREQPFRMVEKVADRQIRALGGIYRILVKEL